MRSILIGLLIAIISLIVAYFAASAYPDAADQTIAPICTNDEDSWLCSKRITDGAGNKFSCRLQGCCSSHDGIKSLDFDTEKVMCRDGEESEQCSCERIS